LRIPFCVSNLYKCLQYVLINKLSSNIASLRMKFLFISILLIAGTYATLWNDNLGRGACVGADGKVFDGFKNTVNPNLYRDITFYNAFTYIETCKIQCERFKGCYGVQFERGLQCRLVLAPIANRNYNGNFFGKRCLFIYTAPTASPTVKGMFQDTHPVKCRGECVQHRKFGVKSKANTFKKCRENCVANARCKGIQYYSHSSLNSKSSQCTVCYVTPVILKASWTSEVVDPQSRYLCSLYTRHENWSALNTTHTNKPNNKPNNLPDQSPQVKRKNEQGVSGASSVSLNVSALLVVVFASLFL